MVPGIGTVRVVPGRDVVVEIVVLGNSGVVEMMTGVVVGAVPTGAVTTVVVEAVGVVFVHTGQVVTTVVVVKVCVLDVNDVIVAVPLVNVVNEVGQVV